MLFKIKSFLYNTMKHIANEYGSGQYRLLHGFDIILSFYWIIRLFFIVIMYLDPEQYPFYQYDYVPAYFWKYRKIMNKFFTIIFMFIVILGILGIRTFFYQSPKKLSFQVLYDCIVYNTDQYWKSMDTEDNIQRKKSDRFQQYRQQFEHDHRFLSMINPLADRLVSLKVWIDSWLQMDRIDRKLFQQHNRMRLFPHSPIEGRNRVLLFIFLSDYFNYYFQITCHIIIIIAAIVIVSQSFQTELMKNSLIMKSGLTIEAILIFNTFSTLGQSAILLSCSIISSYLIYHGNLYDMNHKFINILNKSKYHNQQINGKQLRFYLNEHTRLSYFVLYNDKTTWSDALYYYALLSIPINITLMCELIVEDIIPETKFLFIIIIVLHSVTGSFPFLLLANMSNDFHSINKHLPEMQLQLKRSTHLRLKLKYDDLYERLIWGKKIVHTFGTLGNLTFRGLFEAFLGYFVAFFLILKVYMNEQSQSRG
ncbi:uncharacterized protein LOC113795824 [Dermatophagoides pteronyssinus]|uniref:uncharacterized protein LOC113795824 n=1 Tax=Dermatophagoides pteronyssinus TaxID=6956 RepID=UPI003F67E94E